MPTETTPSTPHLSYADRRRFLTSSTAAALGVAGTCSGAIMAQPSPSRSSDSGVSPESRETFRRVAAILTDRPQLDTRLAASALAALAAQDQTFVSSLSELAATLDRENIENAEKFVRSDIAREQPLASTARDIVSALYTGRVGKGAQARLVAFEMALMYEPTREVTVIPTYARGGRDYWVAPPRVRG